MTVESHRLEVCERFRNVYAVFARDFHNGLKKLLLTAVIIVVFVVFVVIVTSLSLFGLFACYYVSFESNAC